jgi:uncharacterized damage-inducible protein DinB
MMEGSAGGPWNIFHILLCTVAARKILKTRNRKERMNMEHLMKILDHHMDLTRKLMTLVPEGKEEYAPSPAFMPIGLLLTHLAESPMSFVAIVMNQFPSMEQMEAMAKERKKSTPAEAVALFDTLAGQLTDALKKLQPEFYNNGMVHTPFMGDAPCWIVMASVLEHLINHRHQLFTYLKLMGLPVDTGTLYFGMLKTQAGA